MSNLFSKFDINKIQADLRSLLVSCNSRKRELDAHCPNMYKSPIKIISEGLFWILEQKNTHLRNSSVMRIPHQLNQAAETCRQMLGYISKPSSCGLSHVCPFIANSPLNVNEAYSNQLLQLLLRVNWTAVILLCPFFSNKRIVVNYYSWNVSFDIRCWVFFSSFTFLV